MGVRALSLLALLAIAACGAPDRPLVLGAPVGMPRCREDACGPGRFCDLESGACQAVPSPPLLPPVLAPVVVSDRAYLISWTQPNGIAPAGGYEVLIDGGGDRRPTGSNALRVDGLAPDEPHCFQVRGVDPSAAEPLVSNLACAGALLASTSIVMIGDSTMATYLDPPPDRPTLTGWGQVFADPFVDSVVVVNLAASGHSARSFMESGLWEAALPDVARAGYLVIQFGHNDQKPDDRHSDPATTFRDFLRAYVAGARALGVVPILASPIARRTFDAAGRPYSTLDPYAAATLAVADEQGVAVIDHHRMAMDLYARLGDAGSAWISAGPLDRTHLSRDGAIAMSGLAAEALGQSEPTLAGLLR